MPVDDVYQAFFDEPVRKASLIRGYLITPIPAPMDGHHHDVSLLTQRTNTLAHAIGAFARKIG